MHEYLNKSVQHDIQSDAIVKNFVTQASQLTSINLHELQREKETLNGLTVEIKKLKAPSAFKNHKETLVTVMEQRLFIITYLEHLLNTGGQYTSELTPHINELNVNQEMKRSALINALEEANVEYIIKADGTIQYQHKSYLYKMDQP